MTPLDELLDTLDQATAPADPPMLVAAFGDPGSDRVLATDNDLRRLIGWRLPDECWAAGVVSPGTGRPLGGGPPAIPVELPARVITVCLVGRDGTVASRLRAADGTVLTSGEAEGRLVDALRRSLGLSTPPPERGPEDLLAVLWLEAVGDAAERGARLGWREVAALHPAMRSLPGGVDEFLDQFTMVARVATTAWTWESLRTQAAGGTGLAGLVPPGSAGWMDTGMFARWVMGTLPDLELVRRGVWGRLPASVRRRIAEVLTATGAGGSDRPGGADHPGATGSATGADSAGAPNSRRDGYPPPAAPGRVRPPRARPHS